MTSIVKDKVDKLMTKQMNKNKAIINNALIEPLTQDYPFCTNGIYFLCNKMGGGKTYWIMRHIMITERLFHEPYYDTIVFTSTSGTLDKTVSSLQPQIKTPLTYIKDSDLMQYLDKHIKNKMKFYAVMEFLNSNGETINDIMTHLIEKHRWIKYIKGKKTYDLRRMIDYVQRKMTKYNFNTYPSNTLLILDDFAGHPLLKKVDSPLGRMLTKTRHYHLTVIIAAQTWRFINLNIKRLCSDIIIGKGFSIEDFENMIKQTPGSFNFKQLWLEYSSLKGKHSKMICHCVTNEVEIEDE